MTSFRVLHVDDEPDIREVVELSLALDPDLALKSCASGREALNEVEEWTPDLVLLDVMMPLMDGPTTLRHLRDMAPLVATPVVFMTARAQAREIESFKSLGVAGVIPKPFDPMTLAASVRGYVKPPPIDLSPLVAGFHERALRDAVDLKALRLTLTTDGADPKLDDIRVVAHGLAGAASVFGFPIVSKWAASLLEITEAALEHQTGRSEIETALDALVTELERV